MLSGEFPGPDARTGKEGDTIRVDRGPDGLTFSLGVEVVEGEVVAE